MAILFDAYDELLNLFEKPYSFKVLKKNFYLLIGMALGTVGAVLGLTVLFSRFPLLMTCFFFRASFVGSIRGNKKSKKLIHKRCNYVFYWGIDYFRYRNIG